MTLNLLKKTRFSVDGSSKSWLVCEGNCHTEACLVA